MPSAPAQKHWASARAQLDAEIAYWLPQTAPRVRWLLPADIQRVLRRSPGLGIEPDHLAVGSFQNAQVKRIGDPLFGDLRRLAAVMDAPLALIPVAAEFIGESESSAQLHIATAVIDALEGNVLWFGIIAGEMGAVGADATVASAAQAFGRAFAPRQN